MPVRWSFCSPRWPVLFYEFNARIQVEHGITEEVTGLDLVREQIRLASGAPLGYSAIPTQGAAIEARINAENPEMNFRPTPGLIKRLQLPGGPGIRVDTGIFAGYEVPHYYDSLLAKVIARGKDRTEAIERMCAALEEFNTEGVTNTAPPLFPDCPRRPFPPRRYRTGLGERISPRNGISRCELFRTVT